MSFTILDAMMSSPSKRPVYTKIVAASFIDREDLQTYRRNLWRQTEKPAIFAIDCWQPASILPKMGSGIPERIGWAVETLAVRGDDCLLEVGCGRGVAIAQIAPLLTSGHVLAIDRSATAIAAAKAHNRKSEAAGKVTFRRLALC